MLLLFFLTFFFLSNVAALSIIVQPDTIVGQPSLVLWEREPSDGNGLLVFDLRFVKPDNEDVGLALANIQAPPSTEFGTVQVVFPSSGSYLLVAVSDADLTDLGQSSQVNAFQVPTTSIPTSTSQPVPSATSSATPTSTTTTTPSGASRKEKNLGAIIGGTLGGVAFLGLIAALVFFYLRRRHHQPTQNKRWTFYRDKMVLPPVLDIHRTSPMNSQFFSSSSQGEGDIEQQGREGLPRDDTIPIPITSSPIASSSSGPPRPPLHDRPLPLLPPPLPVPKSVEEQMEQLRYRIEELEKSPGLGGSTHKNIILDDLRKQMVWLESQI